MSDIIHLLPDSVANQIAAGEVIQRPASVVKELVENAVDAGATRIQVIVRDAGRTLIQVTDNGIGMTDTDARMAFERHATSKITAAADLFKLTTMGFRGEALASICAVAQVEVRTMPHDSSIGTRLEISGSKVVTQRPEACSPGTNMMVKNLFFNVPARRKFLKKDTVELNNILREFERMALVNPGIELQLVSNDTTIHKLLPSTFKQRIADLFGKQLDKQIIPIATETSIVRIDGFISRPEHCRRRSPLQYFTVNGRHMRHPYFHKALMLCFESLIPKDEQPNYFINLTVDPDTIDVNIHPTKNEIKFENEGAIRQILVAAINESLAAFNAVPAIDFTHETDAIDIPVFAPQGSSNMPEVDVDKAYNPFQQSAGAARKSAIDNWQSLYDGLDTRRTSALSEAHAATLPFPEPDATTPDIESSPASLPDSPASFQFKNRYIVSPARSGIMIIDQHRAHERILYHRFLSQLSTGTLTGQKLLFPETLQLSAAQNTTFTAIMPWLQSIGFEISPSAPGAWRIDAIPAIGTEFNATDTLLRMADESAATGADPHEMLRSHMARALAASAAIPAGRALTPEECELIVSQLFQLPQPNYTVDGRLIVSIIPLDAINSLF